MNISFDEFSSPTSRHIWLNHDWHVRRMNNIGRIRQEEEEEMTIIAVHHDGINSIFEAHSIPSRARASRTTSRYAATTSSISKTNNVSITIDSATQSTLKAAYEVLDSKFEK